MEKSENNDKELSKIDIRKGQFLVLLYNREGNISKTCTDLGISRQTYRKWLSEDPDFEQNCLDVEESLLDLSESMLIKNIKEGKSVDIHFHLKHKGRARGYGDRLEVEHTGQVMHGHVVKHYPAEPQSIAAWEAMVLEAETERKKALNEDESGDSGESIDSDSVRLLDAHVTTA